MNKATVVAERKFNNSYNNKSHNFVKCISCLRLISEGICLNDKIFCNPCGYEIIEYDKCKRLAKFGGKCEICGGLFDKKYLFSDKCYSCKSRY